MSYCARRAQRGLRNVGLEQQDGQRHGDGAVAGDDAQPLALRLPRDAFCLELVSPRIGRARAATGCRRAHAKGRVIILWLHRGAHKARTDTFRTVHEGKCWHKVSKRTSASSAPPPSSTGPLCRRSVSMELADLCLYRHAHTYKEPSSPSPRKGTCDALHEGRRRLPQQSPRRRADGGCLSDVAACPVARPHR